MNSNKLSRRAFTHGLLLSSGALLLVRCTPTISGLSSPSGDESIWPINRSLPEILPRDFAGPNPNNFHPTVWGAAYRPPNLGGREEWSGPVIVGGGIAGLTTAYQLRNSNPLLLEANDRAGGNSQGEVWNGIPYSIGAAYIVDPEPGSEIHALLHQCGALQESHAHKGDGAFVINGQFTRTDPAKDSKSDPEVNVKRYLSEFLEGEVPYPDIPFEGSEMAAYISKFDSESIGDHLTRIAKGKLPEKFLTQLELYCWSAFGGSAKEISAAAGLNFLASEEGVLRIMPGGNAGFAEKLLAGVLTSAGRRSVRTSVVVSRVEIVGDKVEVTYVDRGGKESTVVAPAAVICAPKFVAKHIVKGVSAEQLTAWSSIRYRSYLVANLFLNKPVDESFYELFMLGNGKLPPNGARTSISEIGATDVISANFAAPSSKASVLTLYRALPYDGARAELLSPTSYETVRKGFEKTILKDVLPALKISETTLVDLRIARWGHALPLAAKGLYTGSTFENVRKPVGDRIFFANQDNWALPAFETSVLEGISAASAAAGKL